MNRKLLRTIGIAIIILPDPTFISDVVGLMLVGASYLFYSKKKLGYERLNGLVIYHLGYKKSEEPGIWQVDRKTSSLPTGSDEVRQQRLAKGQIVHHTLKRNGPAGNSKKVGRFNPQTQCYIWHGKAEDKIVHHRLKIAQI
jgi:hypothetical protein